MKQDSGWFGRSLMLLVAIPAAFLAPQAGIGAGVTSRDLPAVLHGCGAAPSSEVDLQVYLHCLTGTLLESNGSTNDRMIASALDSLRALRYQAHSEAESLSSLLSHRSPLYADRDKRLVVRLRAYVVLTLADVGMPASAVPTLLEILAHLDERIAPLEVAAAARAVRSLSNSGCAFAPYLLAAIAMRVAEEEFSLERYDSGFPPQEATTVQLEAVRTLGHVCSARDSEVVEALRRLARYAGDNLDPRVVIEAQMALSRMKGVS